MNKLKSISEGRRIAKEKAVENPNYQEIKMVLDESGFQMGSNYVMEGKFYSREKSKEPMFRGRFKIQLKQADGELLKEEFPTRESLMEHIAVKIPQLKHRVNPPKVDQEGLSRCSSTRVREEPSPNRGRRAREADRLLPPENAIACVCIFYLHWPCDHFWPV